MVSTTSIFIIVGISLILVIMIGIVIYVVTSRKSSQKSGSSGNNITINNSSSSNSSSNSDASNRNNNTNNNKFGIVGTTGGNPSDVSTTNPAYYSSDYDHSNWVTSLTISSKGIEFPSGSTVNYLFNDFSTNSSTGSGSNSYTLSAKTNGTGYLFMDDTYIGLIKGSTSKVIPLNLTNGKHSFGTQINGGDYFECSIPNTSLSTNTSSGWYLLSNPSSDPVGYI